MIRLSLGSALIAAMFVLTSCNQAAKNEYGVAGSDIKYEYQEFEDPQTLAKAGEEIFSKNQILDKSIVLKDLDLQENDALIGLAYIKALDDSKMLNKQISFTVVRKPSVENLGKILARFGMEPSPQIKVQFSPAATQSDEIAKYENKVIQRSDLDLNHFVFQSIEQRRFYETGSQLNGQMSRILVNNEAQKTGTPLQDFIEKNILKGNDAVSDADLAAHIAKLGIGAEEATDDLKARLKNSLRQSKQQSLIETYVAKNVIKGPVKVSFKPPQSKVELSGDFQPVAGYKTAPISMVMFSGTTCPDCPEAVRAVSEALKKYDGYLKVNWIHNFDTTDGIANMMAQGATCVETQKQGKSLEFLKTFSGEASKVDENQFYTWARDNNLNSEKLKSCVVGHENAELVGKHLAYAKHLGIVSNPTLWIEGRMVEGQVKPAQVESLVSELIRERNISGFQAFARRWKKKLGLDDN